MSAESLQITELGRRLGLPSGWDTGECDPWGSPQLFHKWLVSWWKPELDPLMFIITAFSCGSTHLAKLCYLSVGPADWPEVTPSGLLRMVELGGRVEDRLRQLGVPPRGDDGAVINYYEPLHPTYGIFLLEQDLPLQYLFQDTRLVLMKRLALDEEIRRGHDFSLENYIVSESPALQQAWKKLAPDTPLPDKDIEFERLLSRVGSIFHREEADEATAVAPGSIYNFLHRLADVGFDKELSSNTSGTLSVKGAGKVYQGGGAKLYH